MTVSKPWRARAGATPPIFLLLALVVAVSVASPTPAHAQGEVNDVTDEGLYNCGRARGPVSVSFKPEVELKDLITWAMGFTCRNFVYGANIGGRSAKVTIIAPKRMSPQQAWRVFLVALQTMNLTVVPQGNVLRIVESAQAKTEPLPLYRQGGPAATSQLVRMVVRPEHIPVDELARALDELKSTHGKVTPLPKANLVVLTDYGSSISKMRALVSEIDQPLHGEQLYLIRVRHADATEMASKLQEILGTAQSTPPSSSSGSRSRRRSSRARQNDNQPAASSDDEVNNAVPSKIIADERTNALIVVASDPAYQRVRSLVQRLDVAIDVGGGGRIHVYPLEHGDAEELATTLTSVITGVAQPSSNQGGRRPSRSRSVSNANDSGAPAFEGQVNVTHDKPTNSLVIVASVKDFFALRDVIEKLDTPRRQVFIEAVILEVQTDSGLDLGVSFHGGTSIEGGAADGSLVLGGLQTPDLQSIFPASLAGASGLLGGLLGPILNTEELLGTSIPSFGVLFQALATSNNVNVLSSPHLLTTDNQEAEISVGQNIPYQGGVSGLNLGGQAGGGTGGFAGFPLQSVQRQDVALTLKITPHINASDEVRLEIDQEISDIASPDFGGLGPSWSKRTVKTTVVVGDQQSIVIGGLMSDRITYTESKVPLLGDLPLLGYLFKFTKRTKSKTNLLILLTPYVIKGQMDIEQIVQRKTQESREFARTFSNFARIDYRPEIDYRRKRGLIEEINRYGLAAQRDAELLREATQALDEMPEGRIDYVDGPAPADGAGEQEAPAGGDDQGGDAQGGDDEGGDDQNADQNADQDGDAP
ncbi:type II secretion system secretin GspD [Haliangium sp.]|uniref:type II secretion system secretin GspD n=1 Tax=Haliangium sp. TaxID=2663208 RepID=UPI003D0A95B3